MAVLEKAKLLQALKLLQRAQRPGGIGGKRVGAIGVDADVVEDGRRGVGRVGAAGEGNDFLREVEPVAVGIEDRRRAADPSGLAVGQKAGQRLPVAAQDRGRDLCGWVGFQAGDQVFDEPGRREGGIALQVHDDVEARQLGGNLGAAFGAVAGVGGSHHHLGPEAGGVIGDPVVIGGNDDAVGPAHGHCGLPAAADQGLGTVGASEADQRLAGVAGRGIAGRNGDEGGHFSTTPGA